MTEIRTYQGVVSVGDCGDNDDAVLLDHRAIVQEIARDMEAYGQFLSVRYAISDKQEPIDNILMRVVDRLEGRGGEYNPKTNTYAVEYEDRYSEITGYLWTDQSLVIGGHDLQAELRSEIGRFAVIEVTYTREESTP